MTTFKVGDLVKFKTPYADMISRNVGVVVDRQRPGTSGVSLWTVRFDRDRYSVSGEMLRAADAIEALADLADD